MEKEFYFLCGGVSVGWIGEIVCCVLIGCVSTSSSL